jgi:flagellar export protein FliJ
MSELKLRRIQRLIDARSKALDHARAALSDAQRTTASARAQREEAESTWSQQADAVATLTHPTVGALSESRAYLESLRRRLDLAAQALTRAENEERARREACIAAEREVKKMELWKARVIEGDNLLAARSERSANDELAARTYRERA